MRYSFKRVKTVLNFLNGRVGNTIKKIEEIFFTSVLITIIVLGLLPIISRYTTSGIPGISWTEQLSKQMILWIALLGAGTAVRERSSISIDIISHFLSWKKRLLLNSLTAFISAVVCGVMVYLSIVYIRGELEFDGDKVAFLFIKQYWLNLALPIGFSLLVVRLLIATIQDFLLAFAQENPVKEVDNSI